MPTKTPPLESVLAMGKKYPHLWDNIAYIVAGEYDDSTEWDRELCYCPIGAVQAAIKAESSGDAYIRDASFAAALAAWRRGKYIYSFDDYLIGELLESATDTTIPLDILYRLPAQCVYIELSKYPVPGFPAGFFVHFEYDFLTGGRELRMHFINHSGKLTGASIVHLIPGGTINDGIDEALARELKHAPDQPEIHDQIIETYEQMRGVTVKAMQFVLYICAENAEITEDRAQKKIYRKRNKVLDKIEEIRKWDVGVKTGKILRSLESPAKRGIYPVYADKNTADSAGSPKRTHLRRAHWHHFWIGSGGDRQLILRWVSSTVINPDGTTPLTVIKIKKQ